MRIPLILVAVLAAVALLSVADGRSATAQTTVIGVPAGPVVTYVPERYGLFGLRTAYRPVIASPAVTVWNAAPMTTGTVTYMPSTVVTGRISTYYTPPQRQVYYSPPIIVDPGVTTYYTPLPTTVYYPPTIIYP